MTLGSPLLVLVVPQSGRGLWRDSEAKRNQEVKTNKGSETKATSPGLSPGKGLQVSTSSFHTRIQKSKRGQ